MLSPYPPINLVDGFDEDEDEDTVVMSRREIEDALRLGGHRLTVSSPYLFRIFDEDPDEYEGEE